MVNGGFDNQRYLHLQSQHIQDRIAQFGGKLYLEFGGKLFDDHHASRVLPGFEPDSKIRMLEQLKDTAEIIIAINAGDIEKNKVRVYCLVFKNRFLFAILEYCLLGCFCTYFS